MIHTYKLCNYNIVLDVASGAVHSVDEVTYDVIGLYKEANASRPDTQALMSVKTLHPDVTDTDIRAIADDIDKLIAKGQLFTPDTYEEIANEHSTHTPHIKALCLNVSHECNMNCEYCFANRSVIAGLVYPELDSGTRNPPKATDSHSTLNKNSLMPFETGKQAIDFLIANSGEHKTLDIDFFGGEPLLNWQAVKEIVAYAQMAEKFTDKKFRFTLTTNGLLIDDDVIAFTNRHFYNVVLSLDGRQETHDRLRKLPSGEGSYNEVLPKIMKLVQARREKGYYIRGTYTRENMDFVNDILHIAGLGFLEISLEPAVPGHSGKQTFTKADLPELFKQYDTLAVEMRRRKDNAKFLRPSDVPKAEREFSFYHYHLDLEHGPCIYKRTLGCGVATQYLAVTPDGELYPCHQFIGNESFLLGDVWKGITNRELRDKFAAVSIYSRDECKNCWARFYCSGGCAANAYHAAGRIDGTDGFGCELFKKRIENAIMLQF